MRAETSPNVVLGFGVTQADIDRALDERERQTGSRRCSDPVILGEIASVLRQAASQDHVVAAALGVVERRKNARGGHRKAPGVPTTQEEDGGLSTDAPTTV